MRSQGARLRWPAAALAGACLLASAADAKPFYLTPFGRDSWLVIDPWSAESLPGGVVRRMWTVTVQRSILEGDPPTPGYVRTQSDYDCVNKEVRWRSFSAFSRSGQLLMTRDNPNPGWSEATSAPDIYAAYRTACEGVAGATVSAESIGRLVISLMSSWDPAPSATPAQPLLALPTTKPGTAPGTPTAPAKPGAAAATPPKPGAVKAAAAATPAKPTPAAAKPAATTAAAKPAAPKPATIAAAGAPKPAAAAKPPTPATAKPAAATPAPPVAKPAA